MTRFIYHHTQWWRTSLVTTYISTIFPLRECRYFASQILALHHKHAWRCYGPNIQNLTLSHFIKHQSISVSYKRQLVQVRQVNNDAMFVKATIASSSSARKKNGHIATKGQRCDNRMWMIICFVIYLSGKVSTTPNLQ